MLENSSSAQEFIWTHLTSSMLWVSIRTLLHLITQSSYIWSILTQAHTPRQLSTYTQQHQIIWYFSTQLHLSVSIKSKWQDILLKTTTRYLQNDNLWSWTILYLTSTVQPPLKLWQSLYILIYWLQHTHLIAPLNIHLTFASLIH